MDNIEIPVLGEIGGPGNGEYFLLCYASDDPCFLGRHCKIYNEPRRLLESIPGIHLIEMERNRMWPYCCGSVAKIIIKAGKV